MAFRMDRGPRRDQLYPVVKISPGYSAFVVFTISSDQVEGTPMHWLSESCQSVPCGRETCVFCPKIPTRYAYFAPVMEWWTPGGHRIGAEPFKFGNWRKAILRITEHLEPMLTVDRKGQVLEVKRHGDRKNGPLNFKVLEAIPERYRVDLSPHDITPTLKAMWGLYTQLMDEEDRHGPDEKSA